MSETSAELGVALGVALIGSIGAAVYRLQLDSQLPAGVPPATADSVQEGIAGAATATRDLPAGLAADGFNQASEAFTNGVSVAAVVCGVAAVGLAIVAAVGFRHVAPYTGEEEPAS
jgi:DHA2 family multidrug resistance protein-like MFS transporter